MRSVRMGPLPSPESGHCASGAERVSVVALVGAELLLDGPHLDRAEARRGPARRDLESLVAVAGLDDEEAADQLLGLGVGAVGHEALTGAHPHGGRLASAL